MDRFDVVALMGTFALATGVGLIDYRVGLIVLGMAMITWSIVGARVNASARPLPKPQAARKDKAAS